jgi:hypothetical protein
MIENLIEIRHAEVAVEPIAQTGQEEGEQVQGIAAKVHPEIVFR